MKRVPLVSVVVPAFNAQPVIERCLRAADREKRSFPGGAELIVVDDGSTDATAELAAPLCDVLVKMDENSGAAAARNRGAQKAGGEILVFLDADVIMAEGALSKLTESIVKGEADAAVGRYTERPAAEGVVNLYHNAFTRYHHDLSPEQIDWFWGALSAVKKEAFEKAGGFDERYKGASAEDMEFGRAMHEAGYAIRYAPQAEGGHAHDFTLSGMLMNDYRKAVLGIKLKLAGRLPRKAPGFAGASSVAALLLELAFIAFFIAALFCAGEVFFLAGLLSFIMFFAVNRSYYFRLGRAMARSYILGICLHMIQLPVMGAGAFMGIIGELLGRSPYGRPGWM